MDLKTFYRKIREVEAAIPGDCVVLRSHATPDGGREGVLVEAPRSVAARLIVEGRAELATAEQAAAFREGLRTAQAEEESRRAAARIQVNVISQQDAGKIKPQRRKDRREG